MFNFTLYAPTKVLFGKDQIAEIAAQLPQGSRVMLTYGGGSVQRNGVLQQVLDALSSHFVIEFSGIEPNPDYATLMQAVELGREHQINFLLAIGGGSVIDGTKFIAAALHYQDDPWTILTRFASGNLELSSVVPIGAVLTLPATGSEMNAGAVISRRETGDKLVFKSDLVIPKFAVLDPVTTFSLPKHQIANGVIDAFVHTIEQYLTYPVNAKVQDRLAEGLLQTLIEEGPEALKNPEDYQVRANIMWAATMALNGYVGAGVPQDWSTHMIGHELTALHGLDHAQTLAIVLPAMLQTRRHQKKAKLLQYAARVWGLHQGSEDDRIDAAIESTRAFFEVMGVPTQLSGYGISGSSIEDIVSKLTEHGMTALGEHADITPEISRIVLQTAA